MARASLLYNQATLDDDEFVDNFIARNDVLDTLLRRLSVKGDALHHILIGPRGMGKTSLLRRLAIGIKRDPGLSSRYIPLNFREEQYNVLKIGDFWHNCGEALAEWAEDIGDETLATRLDDALASNAWDNEHAAARFQAELEALGRRAVLLVDNLDLILSNLSFEDNWKLRHTLQLKNGPVMVGAATQMLEQSSQNKAAFYEFFQPHHLIPLDIAETELCMRTLAERRSENGAHVLAVLDRQPQRLRTLHTLTGGNPRILTLIYRLLETSESDAAMADLEILLDQVTPYYKARIEEYQTPQQRAIIDAIALNWDPVTTGQLSGLTRIAVTTLSGQLIKLTKDGLLEKVETSGSYGAHQLVERFFNIWYLMRHGTRRTKQKMRWLVAFLTCFYSSRELAEIARRAKRAGAIDGWHADFASAFQAALQHKEEPQILEVARPKPASFTSDEMQEALALANRAAEAFRAGNHDAALTILDELIARFDGSNVPQVQRFLAHSLLNRLTIIGHAGHVEAQQIAVAEFASRFGKKADPEIRALVANSRISLGIALQGAGRADEGRRLMEDVFEELSNANSAPLRVSAATALRAIATSYAIDQETDLEIAAGDRLLESFLNAEEIEIQRHVAATMANRAHSLESLGDSDAAIQGFGDIVLRFGESDDYEIQRDVARALISQDFIFEERGDRESAFAALDEIIHRFGKTEFNDDEGSLFERVSLAFFLRANLLAEMDDPLAAVVAYDECLRFFGDAQSPRLRSLVVGALMGKAMQYRNVDDAGRAFDVFVEVVERFRDAPEVDLLEPVEHALLSIGLAHDLAERLDEADAAYGELVDRMEQRSDPADYARLAYALSLKADIFTQRKEFRNALELLDHTIERFTDNDHPEVQSQVADLMIDKALVFAEMAQVAEEIAMYDAVIDRFKASDVGDQRELVARAYAYKGVTLAGLADIEGAIASLESAIALGEPNSGADMDETVDQARFWLARVHLDQTGELDRAEELFTAANAHAGREVEASLAWLYLLRGDMESAAVEREKVGEHSRERLALLDVAFELRRSNLGLATDKLNSLIGTGVENDDPRFSDDFERMLRIAESVDYGEELIAWFEKVGYAERASPVIVAFKAFVRGKDALLDVNPEVREPASHIFRRLMAPRSKATNA